MRNLILSIFIFIFIIGLTNAVDIREYVPKESFYNLSDTCTVDGVECGNTFNCNFTLKNSFREIINNEQGNKDGIYWKYQLNHTQTQNTGTYEETVYCYNGTLADKDTFYIEISPNGEEPTIPKIILYVALIIILLVFLGIILWVNKTDKSDLWKLWWFSVIWIWTIAITFIIWNIAKDFLTSSGFIESFFYTIWLVLMIAFPFYILACIGFSFYFIYKQKQVQDLIERGFSTEDAQKVVDERRRSTRGKHI